VRAALLIAGKDLRQRLRDRSALLVAIVVPLVLASIFGLIFKNAINGRVTFKFGLVDEDRAAAAQAFANDALKPLERSGLISVRIEPSLAAGRSDTDSDKVAATFVLPSGFSAAVASGGPARMSVLASVSAPIGVQVAQAIASSYTDSIETIRIAERAASPASPPGHAVSVAPGVPTTPIRIADTSTRSRQLDAGTFYAAGMAVFFLFFTVQFGVSSIMDERRDGTLARMLVAPISRLSVVAGKLLTSLVVGCVSMGVLALATHLLLSAHWGDVAGLALLICSGVLAATCVMALVVTLARTPDQAQSWQSMVALVLGMLGGTFFPVAQAGGALAALSLAAPQAWFMRGIQNMAGGAGTSAVLGPVAALLAFALVTGGLASLRAGRLVAR
jgi:ABC-2 type transport system permease protein